MPTDAEGLPDSFYGPKARAASENSQDRCPHPYKKVRRVNPTWNLDLVDRDVYCECQACGKGWGGSVKSHE